MRLQGLNAIQTWEEACPDGGAGDAGPLDAEPWGAEELAATVDAIGTGVWALDPDGRCLFINQPACRMLGRAREECLGEMLQCRIHAGRSDGWVCAKENCRFQKALEGGSALLVDNEVFYRGDGTSFDAQYSIHPLIVRGRVRGSVIGVRDITEPKRGEAGRMRAEAALDQFFSASPTPMAIWTFDGRIQHANAAWEPILGFGAAELEGLLAFDLVHPDDRTAAVAEHEKVLTLGKRTGFECRGKCKDGSYRWLVLNAGVLKDARLIYVTAHDISKRKRAEEALRDNAARLRSAFQNTLFGVAIAGLDWRFFEVNQTLCRMTGFAAEELMQADFVAMTHPDDLRESRELMRALAEGTASAGVLTKRYARKDGGWVWVRVHVTPVRDGQGAPLYFTTLFEDLTDEKTAEEAARISEAWMTFALNSSGTGLCYREYNETTASEQQFRLYGREPAEEWISRERWLQAIHPEDRARVEEEQRAAAQQDRPYDTQFRVVWPDRSVHWLMCRGRVLGDGGGSRKAEITVDVTERKRAEAALEQFFNLCPIPLTISGFDGRIRRANPALLKTTGFTFEELQQRELNECFHQDDRAAMRAEIKKTAVTGKGGGLEVRGIKKDGTICWVMVSFAVARDDKLIYTASYDITERRRMEEAIRGQSDELARSNEELERFAYVASHDLQEPLRMVASFTQLLSKKYSGRLDATADRYIHFAVDGAKRMQQLIADLLAYSRVNSRDLQLRATECEAVVRSTVQNLRVAIEECGAAVEVAPLPVLMADQVQLGQLFQNLIGNAVKFHGQAPPKVHIAATDNGADWLFSVRDNGIGIDPRQADRVFQIFQRLHARDEYPGTGIGLAVCKKVVERHGGRIWVESQPGAGSTFRFTMPKTREDGGSNGKVEQARRDSPD